MKHKEITLSDFMDKDIIRTGNTAEVIFEYVDGKPVRLLGFKTKANKSDFEIRELGFLYLLSLIQQSEQLIT